MRQQLSRFRAPTQSFPAVDSESIDMERLAACGLITREASHEHAPVDWRASVGRTLSHILVWKDMIKRRIKNDENMPSVVLEDCCELLDNFTEETLAERLAHLPANWRCVSLAGQDAQASAYLISEYGAK